MGRRVITAKDVSALRPGVAEAEKAPDDYVTKLIKYIPSEIIAAFVTIDGIIKSVSAAPSQLYWAVFVALLVLTPLYIWRVTSDPNLPVATTQIVLSTIAFAIWVFALGGPFTQLSWYQPGYGAILLALYTLVIPIVTGR